MNSRIVDEIITRIETKEQNNFYKLIRSDPSPTEDHYFRKLLKHLVEKYYGRVKIYLDQNIVVEFINLKKINTATNEYGGIYNQLRQLVKEGTIICPFSYSNYFEALKQTDRSSLEAFAKIGDELSGGLSTLSPLQIIKNELSSLCENKKEMPKPWNFTAMLSEIDLYWSPSEILTPLEVKKAKLMLISQMTFREFISFVKSDHDNVRQMEDDIAIAVDDVKRSDHPKNYNIFHNLHLTELLGIRNVMKRLDPILWRKCYHALDDERIEAAFASDNAIRNLIPFSYITSGIRAAYRWDYGRNSYLTDHFDIYHAAFGLSYYDVMITERGLKHIICNNPLKIDQDFQTEVLSGSQEIIKYFENMET